MVLFNLFTDIQEQFFSMKLVKNWSKREFTVFWQHLNEKIQVTFPFNQSLFLVTWIAHRKTYNFGL